jgi:hypothetical protein
LGGLDSSLSVLSVAVDPSAPSTLYAATFKYPTGSVLKSTDGGERWAEALSATIFALSIDPSSPTTVYAAGYGVYRSADAGNSWSSVASGLQTSPGVSPTGFALAIDPAALSAVYLGTDFGDVFKANFIGSASDQTLAAVIPVAISGPGANGSFFATAARLHNPSGSTPMIGYFVFHPAGRTAGSSDPALAFLINPSSTLVIPDLLSAIGRAGIGAVDIRTASGAVPTGEFRVLSASECGTTGFVEGLVDPKSILASPVIGLLMAPDDPVNFRFNIGIRSFQGGVTLGLSVFNKDGQLRQQGLSLTYDSNYVTQIPASELLTAAGSSPFLLEPSDTVQIEVFAGSAMIYGVMEDNQTHDVAIQMVQVPR